MTVFAQLVCGWKLMLRCIISIVKRVIGKAVGHLRLCNARNVRCKKLRGNNLRR